MSEKESEEQKLKEARSEAQRLLEAKSVILASADQNAEPHASYAPFVRDAEGAIYVYLSELARHYHTLTENSRASAFFVEDEALSANIFARKRLTVQCSVQPLPREEEQAARVFDLFSERYGKFFAHLKDMKDFHLFRLSPENATLVIGFGAAYRLDKGDLSNIAWLRGEHGKAGAGLAHA
ncbi:MAG: pyridoxamine 5'-phosphate oxidase family protein [Spirochaetales bacterium]|nr:pyridoxamine 5'-phosphate oxidase family protein [Spirochaetales bacterium]